MPGKKKNTIIKNKAGIHVHCTYLFERVVLTSCEHVFGHVSVQVALLAKHVVTFPALKIEQPIVTSWR